MAGGLQFLPIKERPPGNKELETTKSNPFSNTFKMTDTIPLRKHMERPSILQLIVLFVFKFNLKKNKIRDKSEPFDCHKYQFSKLWDEVPTASHSLLKIKLHLSKLKMSLLPLYVHFLKITGSPYFRASACHEKWNTLSKLLFRIFLKWRQFLTMSTFSFKNTLQFIWLLWWWFSLL